MSLKPFLLAGALLVGSAPFSLHADGEDNTYVVDYSSSNDQSATFDYQITSEFAPQASCNAACHETCQEASQEVCVPAGEEYYFLPAEICCNDNPCCYSLGTFYIGGGASYVDTHLPQNLLLSQEVPGIISTTDRSSNRWVAYAGYRIPVGCGWSFGIEGGYKDLGEFNTSSPFTALATSQILNIANRASTQIMQRRTTSQAWDALLTALYQHESGVNFFLKGGPAWIRMKLREQNLPFVASEIRGLDESVREVVFSQKSDFVFYNVYPELTLGMGYQFFKVFNLSLAWSHIFGPTATSRYTQEIPPFVPVGSPIGITGNFLTYRRVAEAPSFDILMVTLDIAFNL